MQPTFQERLDTSRRKLIIGREKELQLLDSLLSGDSALSLIFVHGPGGIGKSTLLSLYAMEAKKRGFHALTIDVSELPPARDILVAAMTAQLSALSGATLLIVDVFEAHARLEEIYREELLPRLPPGCVVVIAGRLAPSDAWTRDAAWADCMRVISLENLNLSESRKLLEARRVPEEYVDELVEVCGGYPLGLATLAEMAQDGVLRTREAGANVTDDALRGVIERVLDAVPDEHHQRALFALSIPRAMSLRLFQRIWASLDPEGPPAEEMFEWLRGLSCTRMTPQGLSLHATFQEHLSSDLHRHFHADYVALMDPCARTHLEAHSASNDPLLRTQIFHNLLWCWRHTDPIRQQFLAAVQSDVYHDAWRAEDAAAVDAAILRHEGEESLVYALKWRELQPEGLHVFRRGRDVVGFCHFLELKRGDDDHGDPAVQAVLKYAEEVCGRDRSRTISLVRHWMALESHQAISVEQSEALAFVAAWGISRADFSVSLYHARGSVSESGEIIVDAGLASHLAGADYELAGHRYFAVGHNFDAVSNADYLMENHHRMMASARARGEKVEPTRVSHDVLRKALRDVLRRFGSDEELSKSSFMDWGFGTVETGATDQARAQATRTLINRLLHRLQSEAVYESSAKLLLHLRDRGQLKQRAAADELAMSFTSYRRHLSAALDLLATTLINHPQG